MRLAAFSLFLAPLLLAQPAAAAALSVCTEASPEGFDVVQYNSLTTTNASADVLIRKAPRAARAKAHGAAAARLAAGFAPRPFVALPRCRCPPHGLG